MELFSHKAYHIWDPFGEELSLHAFLCRLTGRFCVYLKLTQISHISGDLGIFIPHIHSAVLVFYFCFAVYIFFSAGCLRCWAEVRRLGMASHEGKETTVVLQMVLSL